MTSFHCEDSARLRGEHLEAPSRWWPGLGGAGASHQSADTWPLAVARAPSQHGGLRVVTLFSWSRVPGLANQTASLPPLSFRSKSSQAHSDSSGQGLEATLDWRKFKQAGGALNQVWVKAPPTCLSGNSGLHLSHLLSCTVRNPWVEGSVSYAVIQTCPEEFHK